MSDRRELDPRGRFTNRVDDYIRFRPGYPPELIAWLRDTIALAPEWTVADVGSGTGLLSQRFLENGNAVFGVEPNASMRAAAERLFADNARFTSIDGSAEATTLSDASVELVAAAQAFHWFDPAAARREWRRISRPGGFALVVFNTRRIDATPFMRDYEHYLLDHAVDYAGVNHLNDLPERLHTLFDGYREWRHAFTLRHRYEDVRGLSMSSSYVPAPGRPTHDVFFDGLRKLFDAHAEKGVVEFPYTTEAYVGTL